MKCKNCDKDTVGKSKYCAEHREIAAAKFREMIKEQNAEKAEREARFEKIYAEAIDAGMEAAVNCVPEPMYVVEHAIPFDDNSPIVKEYAPVMEGVCGFGWINIKPGNSAFANFLKKRGLARSDSYYGGVTIWVSAFGTSYERKMAYANAFAKVLRKHEIKAYAMGKVD